MGTYAKKRSSIWPYILLWLFFAYLYTQLLGFHQAQGSNPLIGGMYFIQFGIHEAAHLVFMFLPPVLTAAAGSFSEIAFTSLLVLAAVRAKSWFAAIFSMLWLMMAMISVANYMADARAQVMPLIGPGADPKHDWNFVFGELGLLEADIAIATTIRILAYIVGAAALGWGLVLIVKRASPPSETAPLSPVELKRFVK